MKKFDVEITETLQRTVSVEADSRAEAERLVTEAWNNEDYVLDSTDFVGVDFKTVGEQELSENRKMEILLVQPGMYPQKATIGTELKDFQDAVGGTIAATANIPLRILMMQVETSNTNEYPTDGQTVSAPFVEHLRANTNAPMILKRTPMSLFIRFDRRIFLR